MFYLVREFACCTEFCVLTIKYVVKVVILFEVVTCNSFEVLTRVMFELMVSRALAYLSGVGNRVGSPQRKQPFKTRLLLGRAGQTYGRLPQAIGRTECQQSAQAQSAQP